MNDERQLIFSRFVSSLTSDNLNFNTIGQLAKGAEFFLENTEEINRRGLRKFSTDHADDMARYPYIKIGALKLLDMLGIGYGKNRKAKKKRLMKEAVPLTEQQQSEVNAFLLFLQQDRDYSPNTLQIYSTALRNFFRYYASIGQDNAQGYIEILIAQGRAPQTVRLHITALERYGEMKKVKIKLRRPKFQRRLETDNIPTEAEYNKLLDVLQGQPWYFYIKILATTGARLSEFMQMTWENVIEGEVTLKGKGNKYRRFFFNKQLVKEAREYVKANSLSGTIAMGRFGKLSDRGFSSRLKAIGTRLGIDKDKLHAHAFRHFFAKMYLKKTKDVVQLADLLGHGSVDITRIYLQKSYDEQKRDFDKQVTW